MFKIHRFIPLLLVALLIIAAFHLGCDELITEQIYITEAGHPIAEFALDSGFLDYGCAPYTVQFVDLSDGPRDKYVWLFGDGDSSTDTNPSHTYDSTGFFTVTLKIWNTETDGFDAEVKNRFLLVGTTNSGFTSSPLTGCQGLEVTFTPDVINSNLAYSWDFGDTLSSSNLSSDTIATHVYDSSGTYEVSLTVTDSCGVKTTVDTIIIQHCPTWAFQTSDTEICVGEPITFEDISQPADGYIMFHDSADWWFGDDNRAIDDGTVEYTYNSPGTYTITLRTVSDGGTYMDSIEDFITVYDSTLAEFSIVGDTARCFDPLQQLNIKFVSQSTGTIDSIRWDFGDGLIEVSPDTEVIHNYANPGRYSVSMIAYGVCNSDDTALTDVISYYDPFDSSAIGFTTLFDSLIAGDTLVDSTFDTTSTDPLTVDTLVDSTFDSLYYYTFEDVSTPVLYNKEWTITSFGGTVTNYFDDIISTEFHLIDSSYTVQLRIYNTCDTSIADTPIVIRPTK